MTKLLHERLRNPTDKECNGDILADAVRGAETDCSIDCKECFAGVMKALADEIERCYIPRTEHEAEVKRIIEAQCGGRIEYGKSPHHIMKTYAEAREMPMEDGESITEWLDRWFIPRPRFEDGEPVQFGDEFIVDRYMVESQTLTHIGIFSKEWLEDCGQYRGVAPVYEMNYCRPACDDGELPVIKRPTPKVLDADDVETKVGDTVYLIDHYDEDLSEYHGALQVMEIRSIGCSADPFFVVANEEGIATDLGHELFTHERPVFDADGVRICKGDKVWFVDGIGGFRSVNKLLDGGVNLVGDGSQAVTCGHELTHRQPDSLERVLDEFGTIVMPTEEAYGELISRLAAIAERSR